MLQVIVLLQQRAAADDEPTGRVAQILAQGSWRGRDFKAVYAEQTPSEVDEEDLTDQRALSISVGAVAVGVM